MSQYDIYDEIIAWFEDFLEDAGLKFESAKDGMIRVRDKVHLTICFWRPGEESYMCGSFKLPVNTWRITIQSASLAKHRAYLISDSDWMPFLKKAIECTH